MRPPTIISMMLALGVLGCTSVTSDDDNDNGGVTTDPGDSGPSSSSDDETGATQPPGDGDGDGDGDDTSECFDAPQMCLTYLECVAALMPDQAEAIAELYGEGGDCWCGSEEQAQGCYDLCFMQVVLAHENNPTEPACHESSCTLDELNPSQPYGPIQNGSCPDHDGQAQIPLQNPLGLAGGYCAPPCSEFETCVNHTQTSAPGTCYLVVDNQSYCALRCYVDSELLGGNQCPCGARCQPQGGPDPDGFLRGICTFE